MALTKAQQRQKQKQINYWRNREEEQKKHYITDEAEYQKELQRIYDDMLDKCQKEIDAFYGKYARQNNMTLAEAKKAVSELDIKAYERKAKRYVKDRDFSKEANEEMRLYNLTMKINRLEMLKANIGLELISGHDELQKFMEEILQGRTEEELKRQAGILGKTIRNNAKMANAIVNASFHNATFSDRIWMHQDLLRNDLSSLLQSGLIAGKNPRVLARDIQKRFEVKKSDAERLMRTELARVQTEAQKQAFERNGFSMYTFLALGDACPICADINGKNFKVKDMLPGQNAPPMHPHCRCSTAAYEDDDEYKAWLDHLANGGTTESWNKTSKEQWKKQQENKQVRSKLLNRAKNIRSESDLKKVSNSSIIEMENYTDIVKHFSEKHGINVNGFDKKDLFGVKAVLAGYDDFLTEFPEIKNKIKEIRYNPKIKNAYGRINLATLLSEVGPLGIGDYGTGIHESAHALDAVRSNGTSLTYSEEIVEQARKNLKLRKNSREYINLCVRLAADPMEAKKLYELFAYALESEKGMSSNVLSEEIYRLVKGG